MTDGKQDSEEKLGRDRRTPEGGEKMKRFSLNVHGSSSGAMKIKGDLHRMMCPPSKE